MNCAKCSAELKDSARFCDSCGAPQPTVSILCPKCGAEQKAGAKYCDSCGISLELGGSPAALQRNLFGYQMLGFFFGSLGCHSFYAGYIGKGLAQLLLSWTGISTVWSLVDIVTVKTDAQGLPMVSPFYNSPEVKGIADARRAAIFWVMAMVCLCLFGGAGMYFGIRTLSVIGQIVGIVLLAIGFVSGAIAVFKGQILGIIGILLTSPSLLFVFWSLF